MNPSHELMVSIAPRAPGPAALLAFESRVRKLSNAGVSLYLHRDADDVLKGHDQVLLSFRLPGRASLYRVACLVRYRFATDDEQVLYSCEYDWSETLDPLGVLEDLFEYSLDAR